MPSKHTVVISIPVEFEIPDGIDPNLVMKYLRKKIDGLGASQIVDNAIYDAVNEVHNNFFESDHDFGVPEVNLSQIRIVLSGPVPNIEISEDENDETYEDK